MSPWLACPPPPPGEAPDLAYPSDGGEGWIMCGGCAGSAGDQRGLKDFSCGGIDSRGHPICTGGLEANRSRGEGQVRRLFQWFRPRSKVVQQAGWW